jgi:hypothetical protein
LLELRGDVLDAGGQADDGISRFIVAFTDPKGTHRSHADGRSSDSRDDLDHGVSLPTYPARAATSYRGLVLTAFQNPAEFPWVYPAGAAVMRCRFYCVQPSAF